MQPVHQAPAAFGGGAQGLEFGGDTLLFFLQLGRSEEIDLFVGKVERRFDPDAQAGQPLDDVVHPAGKLALERTSRRAGRGLAAGGNQVGDGLGLGQVQPAFQEGALGELARPRRPRAQGQAAAQQARQQHGAAVSLQLKHVLAGVGPGPREEQQQAVVDHLAVGLAEAKVVRMPRFRRPAQQACRDRPAARAAQAHDAHARRPGRRRNRRNGLALVHRFI